MKAIAASCQVPAAAELVAVHVEGPYLEPSKAGAQAHDYLRAADAGELEEWMAEAPELRWLLTAASSV